MSNSFPNKLSELAFLTKHTNYMGNLPSPIRSKLFNRYGNEHYQVCVCSMQGYRANMEDSHVVQLSFTNHPEYACFGIFDGHNGRKASQHLSKHLIHKLDALPTLTNNEEIQNIIVSMDEEFCASDDGHNGSTIVFALVRPHESKYGIRVFWAGDSRAILIDHQTTTNTNTDPSTHSPQNINFKTLTTDHRPDNPSEKQRIEAANGVIINNRVDSKLAVSRAFGDTNLKNNASLKWAKQRVTCLPEYVSIDAHPNDILFLFCDGLVEYLDNFKLIQSLFSHLNEYEDPVYGLGYLFDDILDGGSRDNMSAIIVHCKSATDYGINGRHRTFLPGPLYMTRNDKKYVDAYLRNAKDFGHSDTPKLRRAAYREDLKFLKKYGLRGLSAQQLQYGKTQKSIIYEIEQVIREMDRRSGVANEDENEALESKIEEEQTKGSTEVIDEDIDNEKDMMKKPTPPLSDLDDDDDDDLMYTKRAIQRYDSIVVTPSPSPNAHEKNQRKRSFASLNENCDGQFDRNMAATDGDHDHEMKSNNNGNDESRNDIEEDGCSDAQEKIDSDHDMLPYSASKRRKSNIGEAIKIH